MLLTVNGLRAIGQRAALVAHPDGELRRRASEGLELIPLAPRTEMDLSAAWRLARVVKRLAARRRSTPTIRTAWRWRRWRCRSARAGARPAAGAGRVAARRLSPEGQLVLALEVPAGRLLHRRVGSDPADAGRRRRRRRRGPSRCTKASTSSTCWRAPPVNVHEAFWLPHHAPVVGNVAALVPHKGQRYLDRGRAPGRAGDAGRAVRDPRRRRAARAPRAPGPRAPPREARAAARIPHRRARLHQGLRPVRHELGHRRARHVAARRDGLRQGRSSRRAPAAFRKSSRTA